MMRILKIIWFMIVKSLGLILYFSSFPLIIYGVFTVPYGNYYLFMGVSMMLMGILLEVNAYDNHARKAFRKLAMATLIPLVLFAIFNIALTASIANIMRAELDNTITGAPSEIQFFLGIALEKYRLIIPGLWITAIAYAIMAILLFRLSSEK